MGFVTGAELQERRRQRDRLRYRQDEAFRNAKRTQTRDRYRARKHCVWEGLMPDTIRGCMHWLFSWTGVAVAPPISGSMRWVAGFKFDGAA